ncbi:hypothetical protein XAPC_4117 [Xanthomonas citri pv. punicae str. LMG 859]|nr:hypothetical protein XAPC_4117 [Xanthomonas citri pv. punicae str. LMG 859]
MVGIERGARCGGQRAGAQRLRIAQHQAATAERGATGVGVGTTQHQRAGVEFLHAAGAGDGHIDARRGTRVDADGGQRVDYRQCNRAGIGQLISIGHELQSADVLRALHAHRARRTGKHCEVALPRAVGATVLAGPVGGRTPGAGAAIDSAIGRGLHTIPELHDAARRGHHKIELLTDGGLQGELADVHAARKQADQHAVIGERAGVVDQAIHAGAEAAEIGDVERTVQGEIAIDGQQAGCAWRGQCHIDECAGCQRQRAHAQRRTAGECEPAAIADGDRRTHVTGGAGAGQRAARCNVQDAGAETADHIERARTDLRAATDRTATEQTHGAGPHLVQVAATAQAAGEIAAAQLQRGAGSGIDTARTAERVDQAAVGQIQQRACRDIDSAGVAQRGRSAGHHGTGLDRQRAGVAVVAAQGQRAEAGLDQASASADGTAGQHVCGVIHGERGAQRDIVA